jgi:1-acyl-sn-glycerol-3-phosphate acyltransferase
MNLLRYKDGAMANKLEHEIVFEPPRSSSAKPSMLYATKMAMASIDEASRFLIEASLKGPSIELGNVHVKNFWQRLLTASHTTLEVVGRSRVNPMQSYIYMSNHQSLLDIPVICGAVPQSLRMVAKDQLFQIPIFGMAMEKCGFVAIDRSNREKAIGQLEKAKERVKEGVSIWIGPEGTRSRTDELLPFKKGGFHLAMDLEVPIVPLWVKGAAQVIHPESTVVTPNQTVSVYFGDPIVTKSLGKEHLPQLMAQVREAILSLKNTHG